MKWPKSPISNYIRQAQRAGLSKPEIHKNLRLAGWKESYIKKSIIATFKRKRELKKYFTPIKPVLKLIHKWYKLVLVICTSTLIVFWLAGITLIFGPFSPNHLWQKVITNNTNASIENLDFDLVYEDSKKIQDSLTTLKLSGKIDSHILSTGESNQEVNVGSSLEYEGANYLSNHIIRNSKQNGLSIFNKFGNSDTRFQIAQGKWLTFNTQGDKSYKPQATLAEWLKDSKIVSLDSIGIYEKTPVIIYNIRLGKTQSRYFNISTVNIAINPFNYEIKYIELLGKTISLAEVTEKVAAFLTSTEVAEHDKKRITDIQSISNQLERFYNKFHGYPAGRLGEANFTGTSQSFIWPQPADADGRCSEFYNTYWYINEGSVVGKDDTGANLYESYKLTFCLGGSSGGVSAGANYLSPTGIKPVDCTNDPNCSIEKTYRDVLFNQKLWENYLLVSTIKLKIYPAIEN